VYEDGSTGSGVLLVTSWKAVTSVSPPETSWDLKTTRDSGATRNQPLIEPNSAGVSAALTTVAKIKSLSPELARREFPVSIRGILTAVVPEFDGAVLEDSTKGIYVHIPNGWKETALKRGDFYQIDGVTGPGLFAPIIVPRKIIHLGAGKWPPPVRATGAHLINGGLDTEYVEMDGVVLAVQDQSLSLLIEGGKITVSLMRDFKPSALAAYLDAVVRIRGCVFIPFNERTREVETGIIPVGDAVVSVLQAAPRQVFDVPQRSINELRLYDPEATPFRRLKISGQVIYCGTGEYFLTEGTNGVRVTTRNSDRFELGDLVEAVGFLGLGGPAAELREAVMRKTGRAPLPTPTKLAPDQLRQARYADTLAQINGKLVNQWHEASEYVMELQSGFLAFKARIKNEGGSLKLPPLGSRLELTGVCVPEGNRASDGTVNSFSLLLQSPTGIRITSTPPWWTLKRMLVVAGTLAGLLAIALIWNKQLRWQVQERSRKLEIEIDNRRRAEQQRAAEAERARIARDLHDELGAGLTEVSLLASAGLDQPRGPEKSNDRFQVIADKARELVSALDVIVWAIDPKRNSVQSFADYLGSYAHELMSASKIECRLMLPIECAAVALPGTARHSLFLAVKEALNNVIRHASATEVKLEMTQLDYRLEIIVADNGRGIALTTIRRGNGLANLHERLGALAGQCQIESEPGKGTRIKFIVPLPQRSG
jgi:signal transduction histidine kinase